jgi:glycosyltransferase involved in cell wall biosynthesis
MRVWLVKFDESLPIDRDYRPYRMGMLAAALIQRGHEVVWWASTYNHAIGVSRYSRDTELSVSERYRLKLLHIAGSARRAVSAGRVLRNVFQVVRFWNAATREQMPDIIICAMPTPELAWASTRLAARFRVPCIVDARDMWPDVFSDVLDWKRRLVAWPYVAVMRLVLRQAVRAATGCTSITGPFLDWIIGYAGRPVSTADAVFPLGYSDCICGKADLEQAQGALPKETPGAFNVVFLGRLNRTVHDAFAEVISAAEQLRCEKRSFRFYFAGTGDYAEELQERARHLPEICFVGHVGAPALAVLRDRAHAALLCIARRKDYQISLSNKVFEYLAAGLPIISHLSGLVGELLQETESGLVYHDADGLVRSLRLLAEDEGLRSRMGRNARVAFCARFEAKTVYARMSVHIENLAQGSGAGRRRDIGEII